MKKNIYRIINNIFKGIGKFRIGSVSLNEVDEYQTQREKFARIILDQMYHFAGLLDADGNILEINLPALRGAGLGMDDVLGIPFWEARWFALSDESKALQRSLVRRAASGEFIRRDIEVYGEASGEKTIITDYSLSPIRDEDGVVRFILAEGRNITEKKKIEIEVERKNSELKELLNKNRQLDEQKNKFFANISHELRTPLSLIIGPVDDMLEDLESISARDKSNLSVIRRNAVTMLTLVNELLDLAKIDAGKVQLFYEKIRLSQFIQDIASHFEMIAHQNNISFAVMVPDELEIEADRERLSRIVFNLISNAFSVTPRGGRISCTVESIESEKILIHVKDTGPGIDSDQIAKIFKRFEQGDGLLQSSRKGSGLGLAIVKEFVDLHNGTVTVTNSSVGGAIFMIELPEKAPAGAGVSRDRKVIYHDAEILVAGVVDSPSDPDLGGSYDRASVLVVDDNYEMRELIKRILGQTYHVITVPDAEEALAAMERYQPDLIITDLMMPNISGDQLIRKIREKVDTAQIPILVLSARADEGIKNELLSRYVQDYVTKPFSVPELVSRVRNLIMMREAKQALQKELETHNTDLMYLTREVIDGRRALRASVDALQKSESHWRAIYENSAVGIAVVNPAWAFVKVNPAFCRMLGFTAEELLGRSVIEFTHPADKESTGERLTRLIRGELEGYHYQKRFINRQGTEIWTSSSVTVIPETEDSPPLLLGIVEDISASKQAELELEEARIELARVMRVTSMGELVASITHEINQPLSAIVSNSQAALKWLSHEPPDYIEANNAINNILRDGKRAAEVAIRIRGFMKRDQKYIEQVDWSVLISEVLDFVNETLWKIGIEVQANVPADLPDLYSDKVQLQQVLLNLVLNAIDAMRDPELTERLLQIDVHYAEDIDHVVVRISDSGKGIDADVEDKLFEPFCTTKENGLGMGLSICRSTISRLGGELKLLDNKSTEKGCSFQFSIPTLENKNNAEG
ncbi:ATP-binding protein [Marinobacterium litorale]|uniref:ATP-binding protein n=1 Tax=Marinobacterium litorale TaxID=404770 RepID=UPI0004030158|nr:ATP-binding protein [Marinobacterium litorale]